jgi:hypothetical protein
MHRVANMAMLPILLLKEAMRSWYRYCWRREQMLMCKVMNMVMLSRPFVKQAIRSWYRYY